MMEFAVFIMINWKGNGDYFSVFMRHKTITLHKLFPHCYDSDLNSLYYIISNKMT